MNPTLHHLSAAGVAVVVAVGATGLPRVLHWGADPGPLSENDLTGLAAALAPPPVSGTLDVPVPLAVLPEAAAGWPGTPGVSGHRAGRSVAPAFTAVAAETDDRRLSVTADGDELTVLVEIELTAAGLLRLRATLTDRLGGYAADGLLLALPVPAHATELLDLTGRHLRERSPQRKPFTTGTHLREGRRGRTGTDATLIMAAGTPGFGFGHGEVWTVHTAWSGNHRTLAERLPSGAALLGGGELLLPGEVTLGAGESYRTPWVYASYGRGLDAAADRFHASFPVPSPRPVTVNTWEAVYFAHTLPRLRALADAAARVGAERFVLDDGWFRGRRDDRAGLGDWYVDEAVWPDGLGPLAEHVTGLGMQFGLWVEPEMVNPDSDLARAHPDWVLAPEGALSRHQRVLDVARPQVYAYLRERLVALLTAYPIGYLKWDHNRDLPAVGAHAQTRAVYRLLDELRERFPGLEIESCSSGGGRVDLGVLERADRVWASDTVDALERQGIQRWTGQLVPPWMIGAHVGAPVAHTTGRAQSLSFRAGTALFGHFGIEYDLSAFVEPDLERWVTAYRALRGLLHGGRVVRGDHPDPALWVHGVVARDRSRAVYALVQLATSVQAPPGPVRLPGLDAGQRYRVAPLPPGDVIEGPPDPPAWWATGVTLPGALLGTAGVQAPVQWPERLVLLEARQAA